MQFINSLFINTSNRISLASKRVNPNEGANAVEYIFILAIMAVLLVAIFLIPGTGVKDRVGDLGDKVSNALCKATGSDSC